ncbi:ROK family protein [Micromonospora chokoriensis]
MVTGPVMLAVDIGGTKTALHVRGPHGDSGETAFTWPGRQSADDDLALLFGAAQRALDAAGERNPSHVVVAFPGTCGPDGRVERWPTRPEWRGTPLAAALADRWDVAVLVHDDALLGAYAELPAVASPHGAALYLSSGTGIGGAWLAARPPDAVGPVALADLHPAEPGHLLVHPDADRRCDCGRQGCLQSYASGPALRRSAALHGSANALAGAADALAVAVANVSELMPLATVVIGGGCGTGTHGLIPALREALRRRTRDGSAVPDVLPARHGARSSLRGALLLAGTITSTLAFRPHERSTHA